MNTKRAAQHLKKAREKAGLRTPLQVAKLMLNPRADREDIKRMEAQINLYESEDYDHRIYFPREHVNMLASLYGVSVQYLRGGDPVDIRDRFADGMTEGELLAYVEQEKQKALYDVVVKNLGADALVEQSVYGEGIWLITSDNKARYLPREPFEAIFPSSDLREAIWQQMLQIDLEVQAYVVIHVEPDMNAHFAVTLKGE